MANDGASAHDRWARTAVEELRRFQSLRPRPGRRFRPPPMPPAAVAERNRVLGIWPVPQDQRDKNVTVVALKMTGLLGTFTQRHGVIPEPEASRAAAAAEAEGFAAASAYAAGKDLATDAERFDVVQTYVKEMWHSVYRYAASRRQAAAAGTSRAGPAAPPPTATSGAVVVSAASVPVQQQLPRSRAIGRRP